MLCARAVRNLVSRHSLHSGSTRHWAVPNSRSLHNSVRTFSNEARAVQKILSRSNIHTLSLARVCGVNIRGLHTSQSRFSENDDQGNKKNDEDEKARMLSAAKTAMGFIIAPLFLLYLFSGFSSNRRENINSLQRDRTAGVHFIFPLILMPDGYNFHI